jgi:hypothetical protein
MELTAGNLSRLRALAANSKSVQGVLFSARSESSSVEIVEKALHLPPATTGACMLPLPGMSVRRHLPARDIAGSVGRDPSASGRCAYAADAPFGHTSSHCAGCVSAPVVAVPRVGGPQRIGLPLGDTG